MDTARKSQWKNVTLIIVIIRKSQWEKEATPPKIQFHLICCNNLKIINIFLFFFVDRPASAFFRPAVPGLAGLNWAWVI